MATNSQEYKIGDFLKRIKRPIDLIDDKEYKLVTIKLHHNGVTLRGTKKGSEIKSKMYEVKAGDFILSGIDARNGAFGIVPEELDGAIVTNDFWYFDIDEKIIDKHFFLELTATEWFDEICKKGSDGTTQRIRLQKDKFFNQTINLPDRSEQDKLLTVFKSRKKLTEKLSARITNHIELIPLLRQQILQETSNGLVKLREHLVHITDRINEDTPSHKMIGVSNEDGITELTTNKKSGFHKYKIVSKDSFIYNPMRVNVGSIALYTGNEKCITSPDYVVFKIRSGYPAKALLFYLKSNIGLQEIAENVQGSVRQRLYFENLCNLNVPNINPQDFALVESLFDRLDRMKELNLESQANIDLLNQIVLKEMFEE